MMDRRRCNRSSSWSWEDVLKVRASNTFKKLKVNSLCGCGYQVSRYEMGQIQETIFVQKVDSHCFEIPLYMTRTGVLKAISTP
jgi:hypothetical protein